MISRYLKPDWPAPPGVRALMTLRDGGVSAAPYGSLNLGLHVGDDSARVLENRERLTRSFALPSTPCWLNQVHGTRAIEAETTDVAPEADAAWTRTPGRVCAVMTADCLPILLCAQDGSAVAAVHGGWKGLVHGVVASAIAALGTSSVRAWLGPAIGPDAFEVGEEVRDAFLDRDHGYGAAFRSTADDRLLADIYALGRHSLIQAGVEAKAIHGGGWCTHSQPADFFSYRRDRVTGRMAALIWLE